MLQKTISSGKFKDIPDEMQRGERQQGEQCYFDFIAESSSFQLSGLTHPRSFYIYIFFSYTRKLSFSFDM